MNQTDQPSSPPLASAKFRGYTLVGIEAVPVTVEVDLQRRLPATVIVGLPSATVREAAERVRSAILACGFDYPRCRVVVSLAPADLRKSGTGLDLPIAIAILLASGQLPASVASCLGAFGELSLTGEVRPARGCYAVATVERAAPAPGGALLVAASSAPRMATVYPNTIGLRSLRDLMAMEALRPATPEADTDYGAQPLDFGDVHGHGFTAQQALVEAAATRRPVVLVGMPGCGKTMLAARLPGLLPALTTEEHAELLRIYDAGGFLTGPGASLAARPFRAPHHTVSLAGLLGNADLRPGEATLAHRGVLFLDEYTEFRPELRESLARVTRDRTITLNRAGVGTLRLPADYWLVVAVNPCPCGYHGHPSRACICSPEQVDRHTAKWQNDPALRDAVVVQLSPPKPVSLIEEGDRWPTTAQLRERVAALG